jgi:hypothetical protein
LKGLRARRTLTLSSKNSAKFNSYKATIEFSDLVCFIPEQFKKLGIEMPKNEKLNSTYWKEFT